ncbi:flagellar protein export ATPase FliI [bacterium]|nr:flagellar protein export ATPase FliI [bacterium]
MPLHLPDTSVWFNDLKREVERLQTIRQRGRVRQIIGLVVESDGPAVSIGDRCSISSRRNGDVLAEVVGFRGNSVLLMPLSEMEGIGPGSVVTASDEPFTIGVGKALLGRVIDGLGRPIDNNGHFEVETRRPIYHKPPDPLTRKRITEPLSTGIRSIDGLLTCGKGQRFGIFAGSGVGKSVLMGMIARYTSADVNVIALIGERGREVREFIEKDLGEEGLKRSVIVAVTSDQPALVRIKGAFAATSIAEYFRDQGLDVMLMMDSVTRFAMAQREVGLAVGEPPTSRGYTPSLFAMLPKLLERTGTSLKGSITGLYTVLVEGDDMNEPVSDAVRSILDGHITLSRKIATQGQYPALDILSSVSRVMNDVVSIEHKQVANEFKKLLAAYNESEDLINIGAYEEGSNPEIDRVITMIRPMREFLKQDLTVGSTFKDTIEHLTSLMMEEANDKEADKKGTN